MMAETTTSFETCDLPTKPAWLDMMWLELTSRCNLECQHCYADSGPMTRDPGLVDWEEVITEGRTLGCRLLQFIGGEATLHPKFWKYATLASRLGYDTIEVYSNLTTMTAGRARQLRGLGMGITTSFYGPSADIHESITKRPGSFSRTVRGIEAALSAGIKLRVGLVDLGLNTPHLPEAVDFLADLGVCREDIGVEQLREVGRGAGMPGGNANGRTLCGHCWKGKLAITPSGTIYPCVMARSMPIGNLTRSSLSEILDGQTLLHARKMIRDRFPEETFSPCGSELRHEPPPLRHHAFSLQPG